MRRPRKPCGFTRRIRCPHTPSRCVARARGSGGFTRRHRFYVCMDICALHTSHTPGRNNIRGNSSKLSEWRIDNGHIADQGALSSDSDCCSGIRGRLFIRVCVGCVCVCHASLGKHTRKHLCAHTHSCHCYRMFCQCCVFGGEARGLSVDVGCVSPDGDR